MRRLSLTLMLALATAPPQAGASAMMVPAVDSFRIDYDNGDRLSIDWMVDQYVLSLRVNGKPFRFDATDLGVPGIYPDDANIYSGQNSGKDKYFSFEVSVACPEEVQPHFYSCKAGALVQEGKPLEVRILQFRPPEPYVFEPSAPPVRLTFEYTLVSSSKARLEAALPLLVTAGYQSTLGVLEHYRQEPGKPKVWNLVVHREDDFSPSLLAQRKEEFARFATANDLVFAGVVQQ